MWKTHSEDDGEGMFDKRTTKSEQPNVFVLVCTALKEIINEPRDIDFPERGIAPPRTHNGHN